MKAAKKSPKKRKPKPKPSELQKWLRQRKVEQGLYNPAKSGARQWVRVRDVELAMEREIISELKSLAVSFATHADKTWSGEELAVFFHDRMARRRKYGPWQDVVDEDNLPRGHIKLMF